MSEQTGTVQHYLYFPDQATAERAGAATKHSGHSVEVRPAATGKDWLVLVSDRESYSPEILDQRVAELTALAEELGGEYDGHEIALGPN